ncbi:GntR family transcriptional regulator [Actibacterium pelagium]|uniref:GntR family transcriptional regulator n=1 Tax=Actibacterium pelagium TaxID=2029103 RepID=A0A917AF64_9RHOB|nr:GntR family transcriptional regulator [Actibacterium pelagium]GGE48350.1 GntR family transcriptional regulator [Actibacterium pelagium]
MTESKKIPEHQAIYEKLRDAILVGKFAPGEPLTIQGLAERYGAGMTPVRESIRRLTAEHALQTLGNRRVIVPELTRRQIEDIYFLRLTIEPELASKATKLMSEHDLKMLAAVDKEVDLAIERGDVETYLERNRAFHFSIYDCADAPVLLRCVQSLWVQIGPSQRVVCGRYGTASLPDKHSELLSAFRAQDPRAAAIAMREDLEQGMDLICQSSAD